MKKIAKILIVAMLISVFATACGSNEPEIFDVEFVKNADSIVELYSIDLDDFYCKIKFYTYKGKALTASATAR